MLNLHCFLSHAGNSSFTIDQTRFTPGRHTLDITAETPFDQILVLATISFFIQG